MKYWVLILNIMLSVGRIFYDKKEFSEHGIVLNFVDTIQKYILNCVLRNFVPYLSMIDVLMNNTKMKSMIYWILFV